MNTPTQTPIQELKELNERLVREVAHLKEVNANLSRQNVSLAEKMSTK